MGWLSHGGWTWLTTWPRALWRPMRRTLGSLLRQACGWFRQKAHDGGMIQLALRRWRGNRSEEKAVLAQDGKRGFGQVADVVNDEPLDEDTKRVRAATLDWFATSSHMRKQSAGYTVLPQPGQRWTSGWSSSSMVPGLQVGQACRRRRERAAPYRAHPCGGRRDERVVRKWLGIVGIDMFAFTVQLGVYGGAKLSRTDAWPCQWMLRWGWGR